MSLATQFPPLYACGHKLTNYDGTLRECGRAVRVIENGLGVEPTIERSCDHVGATVIANRKTHLYGKGEVSMLTKQSRKLTLTVRQLLSALTGRSI